MNAFVYTTLMFQLSFSKGMLKIYNVQKTALLRINYFNNNCTANINFGLYYEYIISVKSDAIVLKIALGVQ